MYYRNSNWGCLLLMLLGFLCLSAMLKILFTPAFWIVVAIICAISAIQRLLGSNGTNDRYDSEKYTEYRSNPYYSGNSAESDFDEMEYSEGTDDPSKMVQVYESNAVDVEDVEVIRDEDE